MKDICTICGQGHPASSCKSLQAIHLQKHGTANLVPSKTVRVPTSTATQTDTKSTGVPAKATTGSVKLAKSSRCSTISDGRTLEKLKEACLSMVAGWVTDEDSFNEGYTKVCKVMREIDPAAYKATIRFYTKRKEWS